MMRYTRPKEVPFGRDGFPPDEALKQIETAYEDGKLDRVESKRIEKALTRLQAKAAELKEKIKGDAP